MSKDLFGPRLRQGTETRKQGVLRHVHPEGLDEQKEAQKTESIVEALGLLIPENLSKEKRNEPFTGAEIRAVRSKIASNEDLRYMTDGELSYNLNIMRSLREKAMKLIYERYYDLTPEEVLEKMERDPYLSKMTKKENRQELANLLKIVQKYR